LKLAFSGMVLALAQARLGLGVNTITTEVEHLFCSSSLLTRITSLPKPLFDPFMNFRIQPPD
jgi:hypothetical protein